MRNFSIKTAAEQLSVTPHYLRLLERQGRIPAARRIPGDRVYNRHEVDLLRALGVGTRSRRLRSMTEYPER